MIDIAPEVFDELVGTALDAVPPELTGYMTNVVVVVEDTAPVEGLLGLYEGIPLTERDHSYAGVLPDRITLYRTEICAICDTYQCVVDEIKITVVHEIGHHFGIDDDRLRRLGW